MNDNSNFLVVYVYVEKTKFNFDKPFAYLVPENMKNQIFVAIRVKVPFGRSVRLAIISKIIKYDDNLFTNCKLKFLLETIDESPLVSEKFIDLSIWMSKQYFCTVYEAFSYIIPSVIRRNNKKLKSNNLNILEIKEKNSKYTFKLNQEQENVYNELIDWYECTNKPALLYGITGCGKTYVILEFCRHILNKNKQIIFMVPEIALISQMVEIFSTYFIEELQINPDFIAIIHSGLTDSFKYTQWNNIKFGKSRVVIGTRSAVFAPAKNLGLIILDEEQESSYKSESKPRYHTKEVSWFRCINENAKLLLSSATPSIESYFYAKTHKYHLSVLKNRYGISKLPEVDIVNTDDEFKYTQDSCLSSLLKSEIIRTITKGEQVILLLDRRGYQTLIRCTNCGKVLICKNCNIPVTYHININKFKCHICGCSCIRFKDCPYCFNDNLIFTGFGTQRLYEELIKVIPEAQVLRIDADVINKTSNYEKNFKDFKDKKYNIMIGTRMVAKGLNFENVTLVGVISFDNLIYSLDFRSSEKSFSMISQVVGRSGRGVKLGKALIQTFSPDNKIIKFALSQNYDIFFDYEIEIRKSLSYPPFSDVCLIGFTGKDEINVENACKSFYEILSNMNNLNDLKIKPLRPTPAIIKKAFNKFRYKIIIKCKNNIKFREFIGDVLKKYEKNVKINRRKGCLVSVFIDLNPLNIF